MKSALDLLKEASLIPHKHQLLPSNPYKFLGFDAQEPRLGWVNAPSSEKIEETFFKFNRFLSDFKRFLFIGMGGSINGCKALLNVCNKKDIFTLDNLDPFCIQEFIHNVEDLSQLKIFPVSKSGSTKEVQVLASFFREILFQRWKQHFLWITDVSGEKMREKGWEGVDVFSRQIDSKKDIGGRFSCPHTLVFLAPLFIIYKDIEKIKKLWIKYLQKTSQIMEEAYETACKFKDKDNAFFGFKISSQLSKPLSTWIIQLFQESFGSKKKNFGVKTLNADEFRKLPSYFDIVEFESNTGDSVLDLMLTMYFFECFVAFFSFYKNIIFVTQEYVEKYKEEMRRLEGKSFTPPPQVNMEQLISQVKKNIGDRKFIEIVLFFCPQKPFLQKLKNVFREEFKDKITLVFVGSDWNHHSYQSAFLDKDTLYVLLVKEKYIIPDIKDVPLCLWERNIRLLQQISLATYNTLKDKSLYYCWMDDK